MARLGGVALGMKDLSRFPFSWAGDRNIARGEAQPSSTEPMPGFTHPAGYAPLPGAQYGKSPHWRLRRTTRQVLKNPHLVRRVSDRVYELWAAEQQPWRDRDQSQSAQKLR